MEQLWVPPKVALCNLKKPLPEVCGPKRNVPGTHEYRNRSILLSIAHPLVQLMLDHNYFSIQVIGRPLTENKLPLARSGGEKSSSSVSSLSEEDEGELEADVKVVAIVVAVGGGGGGGGDGDGRCK